jgi:hypothetical protein
MTQPVRTGTSASPSSGPRGAAVRSVLRTGGMRLRAVAFLVVAPVAAVASGLLFTR